MPASEARIRANQLNAARSTGPKTEEGKARSRGNALKHGLTGDGVVLLDEDAPRVGRLERAFGEELGAEGEVGRALARRMAVMAVRMDRAVEHEAAETSARVRRALDEFEAPEGADDDEAGRLRAEAGRRALFDPSREATLARQYEAAAERSFHRALKELRQARSKKGAPPVVDPAAEERASLARLASFFPTPALASSPAPTPPPAAPSKATPAAWSPGPTAHFDIPIAIGRAR